MKNRLFGQALISGILVSQSFINRDIVSFAVARILRILPAYLMALFFALLAVFMFSHIKFSQLYAVRFAEFIGTNLLPLAAWKGGMAGVWRATSSPGALNNSQWTIPYEVFCYMFLIPLLLRKLHFLGRLAVLMLAFYFISNLGIVHENGIRLDLLRVILYFGLGVSTYLILRDKKISIMFVAFVVGLFIVNDSTIEFVINALLSTVVVLSFYFKSIFHLKNDYSYGIYLYAWPVSQSVRSVGVTNVNIGLLIGLLCLSLLSYLSWTFIEKPILNRKNELGRACKKYIVALSDR